MSLRQPHQNIHFVHTTNPSYLYSKHRKMTHIKSSNVTIMVKDMDRAIDFYLSIGFQLKQRWDNHYAMVTAAGITIGIHPTDAETTSSGSLSIGFKVDKAETAKQLLNEKQIPYKEENDGKSGIYLHFADPDNTALYFVEPRW